MASACAGHFLSTYTVGPTLSHMAQGIPGNSVDVERGKDDVDPLELRLCAEPRAVDPDQAKRQRQHHRAQLPALHHTECAGQAEPKGHPFHRLLINSKRHKFHICKNFRKSAP